MSNKYALFSFRFWEDGLRVVWVVTQQLVLCYYRLMIIKQLLKSLTEIIKEHYVLSGKTR